MDRERKTSNVGRSVTFDYGRREVHGTVVEDRGPLGVNGRTILRVRINSETEVELPKDQVRFAS